MVAITKSKSIISLEEFLQLPETKPAQEYINGEIYQKPMPQGKHSRLQIKLATAINQIGEPQKLVSALTELRLTFAGRSIVPDITVFEWSKIPLDENGEIENKFNFAPDWIIEILSPEQSYSKLIEKIVFCLNNGSQLGWLIDPQERLIMVFMPNQLPEIKVDKDKLPVFKNLIDWELSVTEVFELLTFKNHQ